MRKYVFALICIALSLWMLSDSFTQVTINRRGPEASSLPQEDGLLRSASDQSIGVQVDWVQHFSSGEGNHESSALAVDQSGNVYVAGKKDLAGRLGDQFDYIIIKYDNSGTEKWIANYGTSKPEEPRSIAVDNSGNVYIHGWSEPSYDDYLTIKYNSSGVQQWVKTYDGPSQSNDLGKGMALDASGNVYVTGWSKGLNYPVVGSDFDFATIKYNSAGVQQWIARYDGSQRTGSVQIITDDRGYYTAVDKDGRAYVTGTTGNKICTIQYNDQGVQQWMKSYTGPGIAEDKPAGIALDASGNVYVAGSQGYGSGKDIIAIKYDASGVEKWVARYNGPGNDVDDAYDMIGDVSGNVYVCGLSRVSSKSNLILVKFTSDGTLDWHALHDTTGSYSNVGQALALDATGNIYVTGYSQMQASSYDYVTIKYNADGQQQWAIHYNSSFERANDICVDGNGGVIVTGYEVTGNGNRITTIKYSQSSIAVEADDTYQPARFRLEQNYPNPFNPTTSIEYSLSADSHVRLVVHDLLGRQVRILVDADQQAGKLQTTWDGTDEHHLPVAAGVYFCRLETEGFVNVIKLAFVK